MLPLRWRVVCCSCDSVDDFKAAILGDISSHMKRIGEICIAVMCIEVGRVSRRATI
jgi:hypothetical protein